MRRIGSISSEEQAQTFQDYLLTRDIDARVDQADDGWSVWVLNEDDLDQARHELEEFQTDPRAGKYASASQQAQARRQARLDEQLAAKKRHVNMREHWERPVYERIPITLLLILASVAVTIVTGFGEKREATNEVYIQHVVYVDSNHIISPDGHLTDVLSGEVWRLLTPIFLHMNWMHIAFNMYILFVFGGTIEDVKGPWRFLGMVLFIAVASNLAQFYVDGPLFGGMSGVDFGLFGYLWMKSKFLPEEGFYMPRYVVAQFLVWTLLCLFHVIGDIANGAHMVGLAAGMIIALIPLMVRSVTGR